MQTTHPAQLQLTPQELNREIKRLNSKIERSTQTQIDTEHKNRFMDLYFIDRKFEQMNIQSMKILLKLNLRHRFMQLHTFGLNIEI